MITGAGVDHAARDQIFGLPETAPQLDRTRTNRIIVYPGSFNPPQRGYLLNKVDARDIFGEGVFGSRKALHLLNHTYYHGVPDLNVIAAIGKLPPPRLEQLLTPHPSMQEYKDALSQPDVMIIDCFATWCGPCKAIAPKVVALSNSHTSARFYTVDVDELPEVAQELGVRAMPTEREA